MLNCWTSPGHWPHSAAAESVPKGSFDFISCDPQPPEYVKYLLDTVGIAQFTWCPKPHFILWTLAYLILFIHPFQCFPHSTCISPYLHLWRILPVTIAEFKTSANLPFVCMSDFCVKSENTSTLEVKLHICFKAMCRRHSHQQWF